MRLRTRRRAIILNFADEAKTRRGYVPLTYGRSGWNDSLPCSA